MGWGQPITTDERAIVAESLFDMGAVEGGQYDGGLANTAGPDQGHRREIFCGADNPLDELFASKEDFRWRRRQFSLECAGCKGKGLGLSVAEVAYPLLVWVAISDHSMTQRERVTYRPILVNNCFVHFHHSMMRINGYGVGGGYYGVRLQTQFGLGRERSAVMKSERI